MTSYPGRCACGAVHYEIAAEPIRGFQCQCRDCQRDTGAGHASVMVFPRAAMSVTGPVTEILRTADSGEGKRKGFCSSSASPLYTKPFSNPHFIAPYFAPLTHPPPFN